MEKLILSIAILINTGFFWFGFFSIVESLQKIAKTLEKMEMWGRLGKNNECNG